MQTTPYSQKQQSSFEKHFN